VRGAAAIRDICERASSNYRDGEIVAFELVGEQVTTELAYTLEIVRFRVKLPGQDEMTPMAVRATSIYRPEDGAWRLVHRHADPITTPRGLESVTQT
jgi:ketosteroid isomerase-like protein